MLKTALELLDTNTRYSPSKSITECIKFTERVDPPGRNEFIVWKTDSRFFFSLTSHAPWVCEASALRARKTLIARFTDFFTDFEKNTDCFAV